MGSEAPPAACGLSPTPVLGSLMSPVRSPTPSCGSCHRGGGHWRSDLWGIAIAAACAVHCAATPLILAAGQIGHVWGWLADTRIHQALAVVCLALIARSLWPTLRRGGEPVLLGLVITGTLLLTSAAFVLPDPCCDARRGPPAPTLLTPEQLVPWLGSDGVNWFAIVYPLLTPLGGTLLATAHVANLDLRRAGRRREAPRTEVLAETSGQRPAASGANPPGCRHASTPRAPMRLRERTA